MKNYDIIIIGGGASGLFAANLLKGKNFAVIERGDRLGKKLSSTGNGQGNITNINMSASHYFADDIKKVESLLAEFGQKETINYLSSLGGIFTADDRGRVYPSSRQASSVTDLLISSRGGEAYLNCTVIDISRQNDRYVLSIAKHAKATAGEAADERLALSAKNIIVCCGGKAQKQFGTDGNFYPVLKRMGHSVTPLYPALVQLKTDTEHIKTLRGIRADVVLSAKVNGKTAARSRGDVIFTEYGISGNAAFYISSFLTGEENAVLSIEFLPDIPAEKIVEAIKIKQKNGVKMDEALSCIVNNQIGRAIVKRAGGEAEKIAAVLKNFTLNYKGTLGFDYAQVTRGGVPLAEVTSAMESKFNKNMYICGEALNVDGECGGYNLQFAFSSAYAACRDILSKG